MADIEGRVLPKNHIITVRRLAGECTVGALKVSMIWLGLRAAEASAAFSFNHHIIAFIFSWLRC